MAGRTETVNRNMLKRLRFGDLFHLALTRTWINIWDTRYLNLRQKRPHPTYKQGGTGQFKYNLYMSRETLIYVRTIVTTLVNFFEWLWRVIQKQKRERLNPYTKPTFPDAGSTCLLTHNTLSMYKQTTSNYSQRTRLPRHKILSTSRKRKLSPLLTPATRNLNTINCVWRFPLSGQPNTETWKRNFNKNDLCFGPTKHVRILRLRGAKTCLQLWAHNWRFAMHRKHVRRKGHLLTHCVSGGGGFPEKTNETKRKSPLELAKHKNAWQPDLKSKQKTIAPETCWMNGFLRIVVAPYRPIVDLYMNPFAKI